MKKDSKILITGGHSTPAFAILDELFARGYTKDHIIWVSEKYNQRGNRNPSQEYINVTTKYQIKFINIKAGKLMRKWDLSTLLLGIKDFFLLIIGFIQGFFIVLKEKPDLILSFGGFIAVPIVFWSKLFGKKVITHEQTITAGLANKIIAKFSDKILISWKSSAQFYPASKTLFTGDPIRKAIFEIKNDITKELDSNFPITYVTGGNQGAHEINKRIFDSLEKLLTKTNIIHQTGNSSVTNDYSYALMLKTKLPIELQSRYFVTEYINSDEIGSALKNSDLVVSRAGANTVMELLALGKLSILMPIPWTSHDEQTKNAMALVETGLGKLIRQNKASTSEILLNAIAEGLEHANNKTGFNNDDLDTCVQKAKAQITLDASIKVVDQIELLLN